jgi:hypothetical protein
MHLMCFLYLSKLLRCTKEEFLRRKKMKIVVVIVGMFIGALAYLESPNNSSRLGNASVGLFTFDNDAIVSVRAAAASISPQMPYYDFLFLVDQCSSRLAAG